MPHTLYLRSYDRYVEILEYQLPEGRFAILDSSVAGQPEESLTFGNFTREGNQVAGVFASPDGPVIFLDSTHLVAGYGSTSASVDAVDGLLRFTLTHLPPGEAAVTLVLHYREREGIGVNPYDNTPEDVDLCALIAAGLRKPQFFRNFTRPLLV